MIPSCKEYQKVFEMTTFRSIVIALYLEVLRSPLMVDWACTFRYQLIPLYLRALTSQLIVACACKKKLHSIKNRITESVSIINTYCSLPRHEVGQVIPKSKVFYVAIAGQVQNAQEVRRDLAV